MEELSKEYIFIQQSNLCLFCCSVHKTCYCPLAVGKPCPLLMTPLLTLFFHSFPPFFVSQTEKSFHPSTFSSQLLLLGSRKSLKRRKREKETSQELFKRTFKWDRPNQNNIVNIILALNQVISLSVLVRCKQYFAD